MENLILAAYSALTVSALMSFILGLSVLANCYQHKNSTFWLTLAFTIGWGAEFIMRAWWTIWKTGYMEREPVYWMVNHWIVLLCVILMTISSILFIKTLAEGALWKAALCIVLCVFAMSLMGG